MADIITSLSDFSRLRAGMEAASARAQQSNRVMWMLGNFMFSRDTAAPQSLRRNTAYTWASQDRFGRDPALQFTGRGADTIDLDGVIYPHYKGGLGQLDAMRELAGQGKPQILVDGRGAVYGKWSILSVEETRSVFLSNGTPRKIEFRLSLQRYGEDGYKQNGAGALGGFDL